MSPLLRTKYQILNIKHLPVLFALCFCTFTFIYSTFPSPVLAQTWGTTKDEPAKLCQGLEVVFSSAVQAIVGLCGIAAFLMLIKGGFKLITSGGDAKAAEAARNTLTYAFIGLALVVLSIFILRFIKLFTGVDVLNFKVC